MKLAIAICLTLTACSERRSQNIVMDMGNDMPASHYNLALVNEEGGNIDMAIHHYQQYLSLINKSNDKREIQEKLIRLGAAKL